MGRIIEWVKSWWEDDHEARVRVQRPIPEGRVPDEIKRDPEPVSDGDYVITNASGEFKGRGVTLHFDPYSKYTHWEKEYPSRPQLVSDPNDPRWPYPRSAGPHPPGSKLGPMRKVSLEALPEMKEKLGLGLNDEFNDLVRRAMAGRMAEIDRVVMAEAHALGYKPGMEKQFRIVHRAGRRMPYVERWDEGNEDGMSFKTSPGWVRLHEPEKPPDPEPYDGPEDDYLTMMSCLVCKGEVKMKDGGFHCDRHGGITPNVDLDRK